MPSLEEPKKYGFLCSHGLTICPECKHDARPQTKVIFFPNGNTAVFDIKGEQIPELQRPWILKMAEGLEQAGIDIRVTDFYHA